METRKWALTGVCLVLVGACGRSADPKTAKTRSNAETGHIGAKVVTFPGTYPPFRVTPESFTIGSANGKPVLFISGYKWGDSAALDQHAEAIGRIIRVDSEGHSTVYAGKLSRAKCKAGELCGDGGNPKAAVMDPIGLALGPDGSLYFHDSGGRRIRRITPDGRKVEAVAKTRDIDGHTHQGQELAVGRDGTIYFFAKSKRGAKVVSVDRTGRRRTLAGGGRRELKPTMKRVQATSIRFPKRSPNAPGGVAVGRRGQVVVSIDGGWILEIDDQKLTVLSSGKSKDTTLGVSQAADGSIFYADSPKGMFAYRLRRVQRLSSATTVTSETQGLSQDGVTPRSTKTYLINGIYTTRDGIYFLDLPYIKFIPWQGAAIPFKTDPVQQTPDIEPTGAIKTLADVLTRAKQFHPATSLGDERVSVPRTVDVELLDFYQRLLAQKTADIKNPGIGGLISPHPGHLDALRIPPIGNQKDSVSSNNARALRYLVSQIAEPTLRQKAPNLAVNDLSLRYNIYFYDASGKKNNSYHDKFFR